MEREKSIRNSGGVDDSCLRGWRLINDMQSFPINDRKRDGRPNSMNGLLIIDTQHTNCRKYRAKKKKKHLIDDTCYDCIKIKML